MTLPVIDVGIEPLRTIGEHIRPGGTLAVVFRAVEGEDYFEAPLSYASFFTGPSDYEVPSNELYCPCGETLRWDDRNLGTAVEIVSDHIEQAHRGAKR